MVTMSRPLAPHSLATDIPALPGLPVLGNLLAFRRDRLALFAQAAELGPIARLSLGPVPIYAVTCADIAREILVDHAASFHKSAGLNFLRPLLGDGLLLAEGETHRRHRKLLAPAFAPKRIAKTRPRFLGAPARLARKPRTSRISRAGLFCQGSNS